MRLPVIPIGNSKGIRIPAAILKQCQIEEGVELEVDDGRIVLVPEVKKEYDMTFENIAKMNDSEIVELLKRVDVPTMAFALIGADKPTTDKIFRNMSENAQRRFRNELDTYSAMDARELIIAMHRARVDRMFAELR